MAILKTDGFFTGDVQYVIEQTFGALKLSNQYGACRLEAIGSACDYVV